MSKSKLDVTKLFSDHTNAMSDAPSRINPKVLEIWLAETLGEANEMNVPGIIKEATGKHILSYYDVS